MFYFTRKLKILDFKSQRNGYFLFAHTTSEKSAHVPEWQEEIEREFIDQLFLQTFNDQNTVLLSISLPFHIVIRHKVYMISCLHNYLLHG